MDTRYILQDNETYVKIALFPHMLWDYKQNTKCPYQFMNMRLCYIEQKNNESIDMHFLVGPCDLERSCQVQKCQVYKFIITPLNEVIVMGKK